MNEKKLYEMDLDDKSQKALDSGGRIDDIGNVYDSKGNLVGRARYHEVEEDNESSNLAPSVQDTIETVEVDSSADSTNNSKEDMSSNSNGVLLAAAIGGLTLSAIGFATHKLSRRQKQLLEKLDIGFNDYANTILENKYDKSSLEMLDNLITTIDEVTELKLPIFIKCNQEFDEVVEEIYNYTKRLLSDTGEIERLNKINTSKRKFWQNKFVTQLKYINEFLNIQREIISDAIENILPENDTDEVKGVEKLKV